MYELLKAYTNINTYTQFCAAQLSLYLSFSLSLLQLLSLDLGKNHSQLQPLPYHSLSQLLLHSQTGARPRPRLHMLVPFLFQDENQ